jgi:hypothetical protein
MTDLRANARRYGLAAGYVLCFFIAYGAFIHHFDTRWRFIPYTVAITVSTAGLLFVFSRRLLFSLHVAALFFHSDDIRFHGEVPDEGARAAHL